MLTNIEGALRGVRVPDWLRWHLLTIVVLGLLAAFVVTIYLVVMYDPTLLAYGVFGLLGLWLYVCIYNGFSQTFDSDSNIPYP